MQHNNPKPTEITTEESSTPSNEAIAAATRIQKNFRGSLIRKKYALKNFNLNQAERASCKTFVIGNDPEIEGLKKYRPKQEEPIAIIANSGCRVLQIACELGAPNLPVPKIFLIDNSGDVYKFWQAIWRFTQKHVQVDSFLADLKQCLQENKQYSGDDTDVNVEFAFFNSLIKRFGFDYLRAVILRVTTICQSWEDAKLFAKVKDILNEEQINRIYVYASNIIACIEDPRIQTQILDNIASLNPVLSIHTDLGMDGYPENFFLCEDNTPEAVKELILFDNASDEDEFFDALQEKLVEQKYGWLKQNNHGMDNQLQGDEENEEKEGYEESEELENPKKFAKVQEAPAAKYSVAIDKNLFISTKPSSGSDSLVTQPYKPWLFNLPVLADSPSIVGKCSKSADGICKPQNK